MIAGSSQFLHCFFRFAIYIHSIVRVFNPITSTPADERWVGAKVAGLSIVQSIG